MQASKDIYHHAVVDADSPDIRANGEFDLRESNFVPIIYGSGATKWFKSLYFAASSLTNS